MNGKWYPKLSEKDWKEIRETGFAQLTPIEQEYIRAWAANIRKNVPGIGVKESMMVACAVAMGVAENDGYSMLKEGEDVTVAF